MSISNDLVAKVEDAALVAWGCLPKTQGIATTPGVPPKNLYNLRTFCHLVRKELSSNANVDVRVVEGNAYGHEHVWLVCDFSEDVMVVDVSTPPACTLHLVVSDEAREHAQHRGLGFYYRGLSIAALVNCTDVYVEVATAQEPEESSRDPFTQALVQLFETHAQISASWVIADEDEREIAGHRMSSVMAKYLPALPSSCALKGNPFAAQMTALLGIFFRYCLGLVQCSRNSHEALLKEVNYTWAYLFGETNIWLKHETVWTVIHEFSSAELTDVDRACAAYQQILACVVSVGKTTEAQFDELGAPASSLVLQCDWNPAFAFFFAIFEFVPTSEKQFDFSRHVIALRDVYSDLIVGVLETISQIATAPSWASVVQRETALQLLAVEHSRVQELLNASERKVYDNFSAAVTRYLIGTSKSKLIPEFHTMLSWWKRLEECNCPLLYAANDENGDVDDTTEKGEKVSALLTGLRLTFAHTGCRVEEVEVDATIRGNECGEFQVCFTDCSGVLWDAYVQYASRNVASGGFHIFLDSLGIKHSEKVARINVITVIPEDPLNVKPHLSVLLIPLVEGLCNVSMWGVGDTWGKFNERARRAVQMLHAFDRETLQTVVIPCPRSFVLQNINPSLHVVDQWLTYFSHVPASARRVLDIQRKKFGAYFRLYDNGDDIYMSVSLRPQAKFLAAPAFELSVSQYDQNVTELIWDWLTEESAAESVLLHVHDGIVTEKARRSVVARRSILESKHLNPKFFKLQKLFENTIQRGMVFASGKDNLIELEIYRDASFFFEVEYMKVIEKLRVAVLIGECLEVGGMPLLPISGGFRVATKTGHISTRAVITSANDWDESVFQFLAKWVRVHLHHAAHDTLVAFQVTNAAIAFIPTVPFVCRERDVYFMTSVYLHNPLGDTHNTFCTTTIPTYDRDSMTYIVDLGEEFAYWFSNRALTYTNAERTRTTIAPFTRVTGKVYICCSGVPPAVLCKFEGDYEVGESLRGDLGVAIDARKAKLKDESGRYEAYLVEHSTELFDIMCVNDEIVEGERAMRAAKAMSISKYFQSFRGMPMHRSLLKHVPEDTYKEMVVQEYYGNTFMHPSVESVACRFSVEKFTKIMYGVKNAFLNAMQ